MKSINLDEFSVPTGLNTTCLPITFKSDESSNHCVIYSSNATVIFPYYTWFYVNFSNNQVSAILVLHSNYVRSDFEIKIQCAMN